MKDHKKGSTVSHSTTTTNNLMMPTPSSALSFSGNISLPQKPRDELNTSTSKKSRGRPLGSKNKPKPPVVIEENTETPIVFLEVPAGKDILEALINLAHHHQASLTVLGGFGLVTNVTLLRPLTRAPAFPVEGPFYMSSLFGTYINPNCGNVPPRFMISPRCSSFSIFLSGGGGKVFCAFVGGTIKAADVVLVKVVLLKKPQFHRIVNFNGQVYEIEERVEPESNNNNVINVGANIVNVMQWNNSNRTF